LNRDRADAAFKRQQDSFERSDTDGFVSQWASGLTGLQHQVEADIVEAGGTHEFTALFDLDGNWVPAKQIVGTYGPRWMVLDATGRRTGTYLPYRPKRRDTLAKHGYTEGLVLRRAKADLVGGGYGLSGAANVHVAVVPADRDWDTPVAIVSRDRYLTGE
jgi:hypothetical protein